MKTLKAIKVLSCNGSTLRIRKHIKPSKTN